MVFSPSHHGYRAALLAITALLCALPLSRQDSAFFSYYPDFLATAPDKTAWNKTTAYLDQWLERRSDLVKKDRHDGRFHYVEWEPRLVDELWEALIGNNPHRQDMLRLPTRPGWTPVAFTAHLVPCVYFRREAAFPPHMDSRSGSEQELENLACERPIRDQDPSPGCSTPKREVCNHAKLLLYPEAFRGGEFVLYSGAGDSSNVTIVPEPGSAVVFDLDRKHASLPLRSERKTALGLRILYTRPADAA